jgi:large subunit ribosomal protein L7/L12
MSKLDKIVEDLSSLTVLEAADLAKLLEEKWGVSAAAPVAVAAGPAAGPAAAAEVQTEFTVVLANAGDKKIERDQSRSSKLVPSLGLKEAKDLVEAAPKACQRRRRRRKKPRPSRRSWKRAGAKVEIK